MVLDIKGFVELEKEKLKEQIVTSNKRYRLAIFQIGDNIASNSYIKGKINDCKEIGIDCVLFKYNDDVQQDFLYDEIMKERLKASSIILQLPVPKHLNVEVLMSAIGIHNDVDGFLFESDYEPCTPSGIMYYLKSIGVDVSGKHCVVVGRSDIVGKPMAKMLLDNDATVTVCHSKTKCLWDYTMSADILISAVGKPKFISAGMVKPNSIVIDVGISKDANGKLCGDVDTEPVSKIATVSSVPGGAGLLTRLALLKNIVEGNSNYIK